MFGSFKKLFSKQTGEPEPAPPPAPAKVPKPNPAAAPQPASPSAPPARPAAPISIAPAAAEEMLALSLKEIQKVLPADSLKGSGRGDLNVPLGKVLSQLQQGSVKFP